MNVEKIVQNLAEFLEIYEGVEFKNVEMFFGELSFEKLEAAIDNRLQIIDFIANINNYAQQAKELIVNGKQIYMKQFNEQLLILKKEINNFLSINIATD